MVNERDADGLSFVHHIQTQTSSVCNESNIGACLDGILFYPYVQVLLFHQ